MARYDIQVILQGQSLLPEDQFVNVLHYEINAPDTVEGTCDDIAAAYNNFPHWSAQLAATNGLTIKVYDGGVPNPAGPLFTKTYTLGVQTTAFPTEVAVCLSYATTDDPAASVARRRGRIYVGPLSSISTGADARPDAILRADVLTLGDGLASAGNAGNTTWLMYSVRDADYFKIESTWVDDAWDTQRRRGLAPTTRTVRDVQ